MNNSELVKRFCGHPLLQTSYDRIALLKYDGELDNFIPNMQFEGCARQYLTDLLARFDRFTDGRKERFVALLESTEQIEPWKDTLDRIRQHVGGH